MWPVSGFDSRCASLILSHFVMSPSPSAVYAVRTPKYSSRPLRSFDPDPVCILPDRFVYASRQPAYSIATLLHLVSYFLHISTILYLSFSSSYRLALDLFVPSLAHFISLRMASLVSTTIVPSYFRCHPYTMIPSSPLPLFALPVENYLTSSPLCYYYLLLTYPSPAFLHFYLHPFYPLRTRRRTLREKAGGPRARG